MMVLANCGNVNCLSSYFPSIFREGTNQTNVLCRSGVTGFSQGSLGADSGQYLLTVPATICQLNGGLEIFIVETDKSLQEIFFK